MLFRRHTRDYRTKFVISSARSEEAFVQGIADKDTILSILERHYKLKILDTTPYHYIVTKNEFFEVKSTDLAHNDNSFLKTFNDDIRILLVDHKSLEHRIDFISNAIALASAKHSMPIFDSIIYSEYKKTRDEEFALEQICKEAIKKRNVINPIMAIYEHVVEDDIIINKNIVPISNRNGHTKLKFIANKYMIPLEALKKLNGHVNPEALRSTDTIFLPSTIAVSARTRILNAKKEAEFILDRCNYELTKGVDLVG